MDAAPDPERRLKFLAGMSQAACRDFLTSHTFE